MKAAPTSAVAGRGTGGTTASAKVKHARTRDTKVGGAGAAAAKPGRAEPVAAPRQRAKAAPVTASKPPAAKKPAGKASESSAHASAAAKAAETVRPAEAAKTARHETKPPASTASKPAASVAAKPSTPAMKRTPDPVNGTSNTTARPIEAAHAAATPKPAAPRDEAPRHEAARAEVRPAAPRPPSRPGFSEGAQASAPVPPAEHAPPRHMGPPPRIASKAETFIEGDHVVYPTHGVGKVERIAIEDIAGHRLELIHITFEENRMTLRVPVAKARSAGLRKLATRKMFDEALGVLKGRARVKRTMWSRRAQEYEAKINSGDPLAIAEVVRDLHRNAGQPDQSFSERQIYESAMDRLAAELAALDQTDKSAAVVKLAEFLKTV